MAKETPWPEVYCTTSEYEAKIIQGLLESEGIICFLKSLRVAQFPFDIGHLGEIRILVPENEVIRGKQIIEKYQVKKNL